MSRLICLVAFLFVVVFCHADTFVWSLSVPISETWEISSTRVVPDGTGGGVLLIQVTNQSLYRVAWFDSAGRLIQTNDLNNVTYVRALRVTSHSVTLHADNGEVGADRIVTLSKGKEVSEGYLWGPRPGYAKEKAVSDLPAVPDKRGFFITAIGTQDVQLKRLRWLK